MKTRTLKAVKPLLSLAKYVGGPMGKRLSALTLAAANAGPDLSIRTKTPVSSQYAAVLNALGQYATRRVPLSVMKRMRRDPQLRLALTATKAPIVEAPLWFDSPSREAAAQADAAFLDSGVLRGLQRTSLQAVDFGFAAHEEIYESVENYEVNWDTRGAEIGSSEIKSKTYPHLFIPKRYKDLDPAMVTILQDDYGTYEGILYGDGPGVITSKEQLRQVIARKKVNFVPPEKSFLFTLNYEWDNPYGEGRLEWAYDSWYWQSIIYLVCNRWYERKSDPPYVGFAPADPLLLDAGSDDDTDYDEDDESQAPILKLARLIDSRLRAGGTMVLPSEPYKDEDGKPSTVRAYDIKELGVEDVHPAFLAYIDHFDRKKVRAMLMPDAALAGGENSGTYGSVRAMAEIAVKTQQETLSEWVRHVNRYIIPRWREYNGIKEKVILRTGGISSDNRDMLLQVLTKTLEADMLLEQAYGPQFPDSMPRLLSRRKLMRGLNIPYDEPDPDAPKPKLPAPMPRPDEANDAQGAKSATKKSKRSTGLGGLSFRDKFLAAIRGTKKRKHLDVASEDFKRWATRRAEEFEESTTHAASAAPYHDTLSTHEKAVAAILLWLFLRSDKKDSGGTKVAGTKNADDLVFHDGGGFKSPADLALSFDSLDSMAKALEGRGLRLDSTSATNRFVSKAEKGVSSTLDALTEAAEVALEPSVYLRPAVEEAAAVVEESMRRFDPGSTFQGLAESDVDDILSLNTRGLLWNIENIAIRNGRSSMERAINAVGNRRMLGVIDETVKARFNRLYSDLSVEAHYRACFRAALVALAEANDYPYLVRISPSEPYGMNHGRARTRAEWEQAGEDVEQFGSHVGSRTYFFPLPASQRVRTQFSNGS